jgi:hypothetical protein
MSEHSMSKQSVIDIELSSYKKESQNTKKESQQSPSISSDFEFKECDTDFYSTRCLFEAFSPN